MILTHRPTARGIKSQGWGENPTQNNPDPTFGNYQPVGHTADDYIADYGEPVYAAAPGRVVYAGPGEHMPADLATHWGYWAGPAGWASGNITLIEHTPSFGTAYSHASRCTVPAGAWVEGGQQIQEAGSTGRSTGSHVHHEALTLPVSYATLYYSRVNPSALYAGGVSVVGSLIQEDDELNKDQDAALAETWRTGKRNNQILEALDVNVNGAGRFTQLMSTINALAKAVGKPDVDVEKVIRDAMDETASTHYVKSKDDATVYALVVETGKLRPVTLPEWNVAHAAGIPLRIVPQKFIDNAPKEEN